MRVDPKQRFLQACLLKQQQAPLGYCKSSPKSQTKISDENLRRKSQTKISDENSRRKFQTKISDENLKQYLSA